MNKFILALQEPLLSRLNDLCMLKGTHLTMLVVNNQVYFAVIIPEYFKIVDTGISVDSPDLAVRLPKNLLRPIISESCQLCFTISDIISIVKVQEGKARIQVNMPLEPDFNKGLIMRVIHDGLSVNDLYDLSTLLNLKPIVALGSEGLQLKDNLAYLIGTGFVAYCKLALSCAFVMSAANLSELTKFIRAHGAVSLYNSDVYMVFKKGGMYFGCRQPVSFLDSMYDSYLADVPIYTSDPVDLTEFCSVLRALTITKYDESPCVLNFTKGIAEMQVGTMNSIKVVIQGAKTDKLEHAVQLPLQVLKNLFSNMQLSYAQAIISVYECYVAFRLGGIDILISRCDDEVE